MVSLLSVLLVLFLLSGAVRSRTLEKSSHAPTPDYDAARQMWLLQVRMILDNLQEEYELDDPPLNNGPLNISQSQINLLKNREVEDSILGDEKNLVAALLNDNISCINEADCSRYEFELSPDNKPLSSFYLWFLKTTPDDEIGMSVCWFTASMVKEDQLCDHLKNVKSELGWGIYELPNRLSQEYSSEQLFCTVEIHGPSMQDYDHNHKPFLVASLNSLDVKRKRRSTTSDDKNCSCCLVDFYVSFEDIGWNWVVAPQGFYAQMCSETYGSQINTYTTHHNPILNAMLNNKTGNQEDLSSPSCRATQLGPLSLIYDASSTKSNSSSNLVYLRIPDMITESCGCI